MGKPLLRLEATDDYDPVVKLFMDNDLEFSDEDPVPTDLIQCWRVVHGCEKHLCGAVALAKRQGEFIIDGIAVEPVYRKMKIGRIMMDKAVDKVKELGGTKLYLVARAPGFFRTLGFETVDREDAPLFFECATCPQYGVDCHPEVMRLEVI